MQVSLMISTALLLASLPQLITYETKAARLPVILAELESKIGTKLECETSFKNDVLVIHVNDVEAKALLDKIAQAAVGKWTRSGDRLVLSPDLVRRKVQEEELLARRERDIQRMLDQFKRDLEMPYVAEKLHSLKAAIDERRSFYDAQLMADRASRQRTFGPLERLGMRSLLEVGARRLAEIRPGERMVFSANPTPRQLKWPKQNELFATFFQEWNLFQGLFAGTETRHNWTHIRNGGVMPTHLERVDRLWLAVTDPLRNATAARLAVVNNSETVGFGATVDMTAPPKEPAAAPTVDLPDTQLKLHPMSEALASAWKSQMSSRRPRVQVDRGLLEILSRPLKNEPLAIGSELYLQYAAARKVNLIAWLNDNAFGRGVIFKAENVKVFDQFSRPYMDFDERDGWLVMTPSSPVEARRSRDDRETMERLIQSVVANKRITFEAKADYVFRRPVTLAEGLGHRLALVFDQAHPTLNQEGNEPLLRLYGSLTRDQRQILLRGGRIPYLALTPGQRQVWEQLVYGARADSHPPHFQHLERSRAMKRMDGLAIEPTFEWPNGIPSGASLGLEISQDYELTPEPKDNMYFSGQYDLARDMFFERNPQLVDGDIKQWRRPDTFTAFERATYQFHIVLDDSFAWRATATDLHDISGPVKVDQLPQKVRDWLQQQVDEMERQKAAGMNYRFSVGGVRQGVKPPPP